MIGDRTIQVSSAVELLYNAVVSGKGAPSHTPEVAAQVYTDTQTGNQYQWYAGVWHPPVE